MVKNTLLTLDNVEPVRPTAWRSYLACGAPQRNQDRWKYAPISLLRQLELDPVSPTLSQTGDARSRGLVFRDGVLVAKNLPSHCTLETLTLQESEGSATSAGIAQRARDAFLSGHLRALDCEESVEHCALALAPELYCLRVGASNDSDEQTLHVVFEYSTKEASCPLSATSLSYAVASGVRLRVIEHIEVENTLHATLLQQQVHVGQGAHFSKLSLHQHDMPLHMTCGGSTIESDGEYRQVTLYKTSARQYQRHHHKACLLGEQAVYRGLGLCIGKERGHVDWQWGIHHLAPKTESFQQVRNVLDQQSRSVFHGLVHIAPHCPGSAGYQEARAILMSPQAVQQCIPALNIFTDDVKCSHGAVVSPISEENLFYMMARGLPRDLARRLMVEGFLKEILDQFKEDGGEGNLYDPIHAWLVNQDFSDPEVDLVA